MAVYNATKMATGVAPKLYPWGVTQEISSYNIASGAAFALNDTVNMLKISSNPSIAPGNNGPVVIDTILDVPSLDTSTGIVTALGDAGSAGRYQAGNTTGRSGAGGITRTSVAGAVGYAPFAALYGTYTTVSYQEYTVIFKVTTAATGTAATTGTITCAVSYTVDP